MGRVLLRAMIALFLVFWLLGFVLQIAGNLVHLLVVAALIVLLIDFAVGGRGKK